MGVVNNGVLELVHRLSDEEQTKLASFIDYFRATWLGGMFPISMWNKNGTDRQHRTNNAMESWHASLRRLLPTHPNLFIFIHAIKTQQASSKIVVCQAERREETREARDYGRADYEGMRRELAGVDWVGLLNGDVDGDWICFRDLMRDLERRYVPIRKRVGSKKAVWMNYRARRAVTDKRRVFARHRDSAHPRCVEANKRAAREVRSAKLSYEKKLADNVKLDSKSFYAYVRSKCKSRPGIGVLVRDDGVRVESPEGVAEEFNGYFGSVFSSEDLENLPEVDGGLAGERLLDMVISREKVRDMLGRLRANKAPGLDDLSPRLLLHFPDEILVPVCMLFEKSLKEGQVPEDWRRANVVPIYKAGDRGRARNYRPVSLTCQLCKIFEKLVRDELVEHLEGNGLLKGTQHGFRKGRSCLTNLLSFLERVTEELDDGSWREYGCDIFGFC